MINEGIEVQKARETIILAGRRLVESGLIARTWGNISCRLNNDYFLITPSGRDYLTLTPEEIVKVKCSDCSYTGDIKPSSEKGVHAEVYLLKPQINFVIHTHQDNASVVSAMDFDEIKVPEAFTSFCGKVPVAAYGLPGTKKLRKAVAAALVKATGNAVIMKNHGALCFGFSYEEAFTVANELEDVCEAFVKEQYLKLSKQSIYDPLQMNLFSLSRLTKKTVTGEKNQKYYCESERIDKGFRLKTSEMSIELLADQLGEFSHENVSLTKFVQIHNNIYKNNKNVNYIIHAETEGIYSVSCSGIELYPYLDDFAQIAGTSVKNGGTDLKRITGALKRSSAVMLKNNGALCCGISKYDAAAVCMVVEKNCRALIGAALFGKVKPINYFESLLMRFIYLKKYSKLANKK